MDKREYAEAWYAGYLRGLHNKPGVPIAVQDLWCDEDYDYEMNKCTACGRERGSCSLCEGYRQEEREWREPYNLPRDDE